MKSSSTLSAILGVLFVAAFAYALFYLARFGAGVLEGATPDVAAMAAGALTLIVCASIVAGGLRSRAQREDLRARRAARAAVYEAVLRARPEAAAPAGGLADLRRYPLGEERPAEQQLLLHASPAVLSAYLRLRRAEEGAAQTRESAQQELAQLVRAMRRDLGHRGPDVGLAELTELLRPPARERV